MARVQSAISFIFLLVAILAIVCQAEEEEVSSPEYWSIAKCFDPCYAALDFAVRAGKIPKLCGKGSIFEKRLGLCTDCLNRANVHKTASQLLGEELDGYLKYCDGVDLEMEFGKDPTLTVDPAFSPTAIPTVRPCLSSICEMTVDRWLTFVTYPELYKTYDGCKNASDQNEIYVLDRCAVTPGCVNGGVPVSVEQLASRCKRILSESNGESDTTSAVETATETASEIETETATSKSSSIAEALASSIAPEVLTETISATVTAAVRKSPPKANVAGIVAVTVSVCALTVLAIGAGIFIYLRRRRSSLQDMPHPPRPFSDLWGTPERRSELPGHHNRWKSIAERRSELPAGGHWKIIQEMEGSPCSPVELAADEREFCKSPRISELKA